MKEKWDLTHKWKDNINKWKEAEKKWKGSKNKTNKSNSEANIFPPRQVRLTVTNIEDGWGLVRSYPDGDGNKYKVPLYLCTVGGKNSKNEEITHTFKCIRFGVRYDRGYPNPQTNASGALGCVEITGSDEWNRFNKAILDLTGAFTENEVSSKKLATAYYERVSTRPPLIIYP